MSRSPEQFVAEHYASRAREYVESAVHRAGDDLDQMEALLVGASQARVLDLGCGGGHVSYRAAQHVREVVACDLTPSMLALVAETAEDRGFKNIRVQQAAAERLPFKDAQFDFVLCRFSTHHWQQMTAGLRESRRVLKDGGTAVFIDVVAPAEAVLDTHLQAFEILRDPSHVRNYSLREWTAALSETSFSVHHITPRKLRMEFAVWIARTHATEQHATAIRSLQIGAPELVRSHFGIAEDGSFDLDTATIVATPEIRSARS